MVGFVKKKVRSYTLGERLCSIREESNLSLVEISKATKIRRDYLEKIEIGDFEGLPSEVYVKGFLRSYAQYLKIDPLEVVRQYEKERGIQNNLKKNKPSSNKAKKFNFPSITLTPKIFTGLIFLVLIVGVFFYFYREVGKFSENPRLVILQPASDTSLDESSVEVIGVTDKENKISINGQPVFVNDKGEFKETLGLQNGVNQVVVRAMNKFEKYSEKAFSVSAYYESHMVESSGDSEKVMGAEDQQSTDRVLVEVRVEEFPVWVSVKVDDKNPQSGTMLPGSVQIFEGEEKVLVTSGKADRTFVKLNEKDLGILGDTPGVLRDVIFTRENKIIAPVEIKESNEENDKKRE